MEGHLGHLTDEQAATLDAFREVVRTSEAGDDEERQLDDKGAMT